MAIDLARDLGLPDLRPGSLLSRTFSTWGQNFLAFTGVALIVQAPVILLAFVPTGAQPGGEAYPIDSAVWHVGLTALSLLLGLVTAGAVTHGVIERLAGRSIGMGAMLAGSVRHAGLVVPVALLAFAGRLGGLVLLVVPGVIVHLMLYVSVPVAVAERPGVLAALRRSRELTKGHRRAIFNVAVALGFLSLGAAKLLEQLAPELQASMTPEGVYALGWAVEAFISALPAIAAAVVYHDLRVAKEGVDTSALVRVFE